ncbi:dyslexia-associated protein KIAA0319 [Pundamilia nyererei]|uniref:Dyslexia-associated protein KIAA0319 n=1 Tax=Pundamilia nyererei TaxID=303518 RepID=A0A9Y3RUZ6_9CICH|nr:PREDICTED: dyslexia-associated protein KIAA0319-like [Pundamilia nyererei]
MWENMLLLLIHAVEAAVASQCWQGATFSEAVVSPVVESSGILRVPSVSSLPQCVAACCDLPGYDLAWLFEGRCYVLSCQQRENCQPRQTPGADSFLAFLRRPSPQTLVLQSLVRGEPYGGRWRPLSRSSEAPGDLEALKDLSLFDTPHRGFPDPGMLDVEYSEDSQEERGGASPEQETNQPPLKGGGSFNQSEAEDGPERRPTESSAAPGVRQGEEGGAKRPTEVAPQESTQSSSTSPPLTPETSSEPAHTSSSPTANPAPPLLVSLGNPVEATTVKPATPAAPEPTSRPTSDAVKMLQSAAGTPPSTTHLTVTSDLTTPTLSAASFNPTTATESAASASVSQVGGSNRGPVAVVGPDRSLSLPVSSLLLNGSGSSDDSGIVSYRWEAVSGPPGLRLDDADQPVATASGVRAGRYTFRLTVSDQEGATDSASLTVKVPEAGSFLPVAHASGSHSLTLPNNSLVLRGSVTNADQTVVHFLWTRDSQSPAAGDVLYGSDTQPSLYLANLVEGTYLFQLKVTNAQGHSGSATATVEVRPEPGGGEQVELEMLVSVSQVSVAQRDTVVRQLAALIHVLDSDLHVRALQGHSHISTVLRFSVHGASGPLSASRLVGVLRSQLLFEKSDYLLFRVLRVDTVLCLLSCSGRGQCDPITKQCACDPFWTENLIRRYLGDGESNCEWRVLYVILTSFVLVVLILSLGWTFICCCKRRRQTKARKKTKYTILDNMDEQERVELRPKFSIKHRSTEHNSSLMMSESELDSDQDTIFSRDRPVRSRNRISTMAARNGDAFG